MPSAPRASFVGGGREVPEVGMGDCFLSKDADSGSLDVLVLKDRDSHARALRARRCAIAQRRD
eukprot:8189873-Alexandrium_andersonii.AAC.1